MKKAKAAGDVDAPEDAPRPPRVIPEHQVLVNGTETSEMIGRSRAQFYAILAEDPTFPRPVQLPSTRGVQWIKAEVVEWILALPRKAQPVAERADRREREDVWGSPVGAGS